MASAKGASLIISLGQRPRNSHNANSSALKAPFIRSVEARLQRWFTFRTKSWGDAPGWNENAPLALDPDDGPSPSRRADS